MPQRQTGFRRDGRSAHRWRQWVRANRPLIDQLGLPADVIETQADFRYLLLHRYNRAGWEKRSPMFELFDADDPRHRRFWELLQSYIAFFCPVDQIDRVMEQYSLRFGPGDRTGHGRSR